MIINTKKINISSINEEYVLNIYNKKDIYKESIFLDLEHYVYKHPICIGIFGVCIYNNSDNSLNLTQFMMENSEDKEKILYDAYDYLKRCKKQLNKKYLVTFSGNNDYLVINHLFKQYGISLNIRTYFKEIDLQKEYEKIRKENIGLKRLERIFDIYREGEMISGVNIAKIVKNINEDKDYIKNIPEEKINNLLIYNEQDVTNLFNIMVTWNKFMFLEDEN